MTTTNTTKTQNPKHHVNVRTITMVAMLATIAIVLRQFETNVPLMPGFIKLDISELPALIGSFSLGPVAGAAVCFVKEGIALLFTKTAGAGELVDLFLGICLVVPAGIIYKRKKDKKHAIIGTLVGTLIAAVLGIFFNYYITFPVFSSVYGLPMDAIIGMYKAINPNVYGLWQCILMFNFPFSIIKRLIVLLITMLVYKRISPLIKGTYETR